MPRIVTGSIITGDSVIEFLSPTPESNLRRFDGTAGTPKDGVLDALESAQIDQIVTNDSFQDGGEVATDPLESLARLEATMMPVMSTLQRALTQFESIGASVQGAVGEANGPLTEAVALFNSTAEDFKTAVNTVNRIGSQVENAQIPNLIANVLAEVPGLFKEAQTTLAQTQRTLKGLEQFSASLEGLGKEFEGIGETTRKILDNANTAVENIAEITEPVSQNSDAIVANVVSALANLDTLSVDLKKFTTRLNNSRGVSELIENPMLGVRVDQTLRDIQIASRNVGILTQKLQPIVGDVRVFSDKLARNPGALIDLKGTLSGRPRGAGNK